MHANLDCVVFGTSRATYAPDLVCIDTTEDFKISHELVDVLDTG